MKELFCLLVSCTLLSACDQMPVFQTQQQIAASLVEDSKAQQEAQGQRYVNANERIISDAPRVTIPAQIQITHPVAESHLTHQQVCIYDASLMQKAAWARDHGAPLSETELAITEDLKRDSGFSKAFRRTYQARISLLFQNPWIDPDSARESYYAACMQAPSLD